jgi:hypothetical protein
MCAAAVGVTFRFNFRWHYTLMHKFAKIPYHIKHFVQKKIFKCIHDFFCTLTFDGSIPASPLIPHKFKSVGRGFTENTAFKDRFRCIGLVNNREMKYDSFFRSGVWRTVRDFYFRKRLPTPNSTSQQWCTSISSPQVRELAPVRCVTLTCVSTVHRQHKFCCYVETLLPFLLQKLYVSQTPWEVKNRQKILSLLWNAKVFSFSQQCATGLYPGPNNSSLERHTLVL